MAQVTIEIGKEREVCPQHNSRRQASDGNSKDHSASGNRNVLLQ